VALQALFASSAPRALRHGPLEAVRWRHDSDVAVSIDQSEGVAIAGLVRARSYLEMETRAVAPTRARLGVKQDGVRWVLENALGARIEYGVIRLGGLDCQIRRISDGGAGPAWCEARGNPRDDAQRALGLGGDLRVGRFLAGVLEEGEFVVVLDQAVFAPTLGMALSGQDDVQVVRGRVSR
jgi:hypothetical protein